MSPRILVYDLEVSPTLGWTYGLYQTNVLKIERQPIIMSFSYRWYGEEETHFERLTSRDIKSWTDKRLAVKLRDLFIEADVVIAHNANRFDNKVATGAILRHNLTPPSPYKTVDTLQVARSVARFTSNSLDSLGTLFGIGNKSEVKHSDLWFKCLMGDEEAWELMEIYNNQDVDLLYLLYEKLRPYIKNHPNIGDMSQIDGICPRCGSQELEKRGFNTRRSGRVQRYQCHNCGGWCSEANIKRIGRVVNN